MQSQQGKQEHKDTLSGKYTHIYIYGCQIQIQLLPWDLKGL